MLRGMRTVPVDQLRCTGPDQLGKGILLYMQIEDLPQEVPCLFQSG